MAWLTNNLGEQVYWSKLKPKGVLEGCLVIGGHEVSGEHVELAGWTDCFAFTVLRDPEERIPSLYAWKARKQYRSNIRRVPLLPFEDWIRLPPADPMLLFLQTCVPGTKVYRLDQMDRVLTDIGMALRVPRSSYKRIGGTGAGKGATEEQRALVRRYHALDCEFWASLSRD